MTLRETPPDRGNWQGLDDAPLSRGSYVAAEARGDADLADVQSLRALVFRGGTGADRDCFDARCCHMLIRRADCGLLVGYFRFQLLDGAAIDQSYSAQHYELSRLSGFGRPMMEMGRFCIHPDHPDPDILRLAWGAITRQVDANGVGLLFGCSSFQGIDGAAYGDAFAILRERHLAPRRWLPSVKAPDVLRFARAFRQVPDVRRAMRAMPPLLKSYLAMGGWVSDHAVVDRDLETLHVFTGLEIGAIPPARARLLRAVAG